MGAHKPVKLIENESGEMVRVPFPDGRACKVWEDQGSGLTMEQSAQKHGISVAAVGRDLKLYRDTLKREMPIEAMREELYVELRPLLKEDLRLGLKRGTGMVGLRFAEGLGILNPKLDLRVSQDNQPTEEQLIQVCAWAKDIPVLRLAMLKALGVEDAGTDGPSAGSTEKWTYGGQRAGKTDLPDEQCILSQPDPGTPEPSGEEDV